VNWRSRRLSMMRCFPSSLGVYSIPGSVMSPTPSAADVHCDKPDQANDEGRVVAAIEEGLADIEAGRVIDDADLDDVLRARLGDLID
jgi:hypothetical protein